MLVTSARLKTARSPLGPSRKFAGAGVPALDLIANSLHHRRDALRRVDAGGHDVAFAHAQAPRGVNRLEERLLVFSSHGLPEPAKRLARLDRPPCCVPQAIGDDERVAGVLGEQLVRLDVQRVREGIPDDLVDADHRARLRRPSRRSVLPRLMRNTVSLVTVSDINRRHRKGSKCAFAGRTHPAC